MGAVIMAPMRSIGLSRWGGQWRARFFDLAAHFTPAVAVDQDGLRVWLSTRDKMPGRLIFARGVPERATLARACELIADRRATFVDVGAHIGTTTLAALRWHGFSRAVCFEPDPANLAWLGQNIMTNRLSDRVQIVPSAVSDGPAKVSFERAPLNTGDGRVRVGAPRAGQFDEHLRDVVEVSATTLDDHVAPSEASLVWIDAQGHEAHVLRGARRLMRAGVPIVLELWPYGLERMGGLEPLVELAAEFYASAVDLRDGSTYPPQALPELAAQIKGIDFTDILLRR